MERSSSLYRKIRKRLGILYWDIHRVIHLFLFRTKRYWVNLGYFLFGLFIKSDLKRISKYTHIIICAHPDDETIFFSSIIKKYKPFVVCMSHCGNPVRTKEFKKALSYWGIEGCMLNMPDVPNHFAWAWKGRLILRQLRRIAKHCEKLECVYTHNSKGESNHPHHHGLGAAISVVFADYDVYMTAETLDESNIQSNEMYTKKYALLTNIYPSQYTWLKTSCGWFNSYLSQEQFERPHRHTPA